MSSATTLPAGEADTAGTARTTITGQSLVIGALISKIAKLARSQAPVFIHGESGSGKERVARMIHEQGPRSGGPFIPVNCGAIPAELMESEFFGHVKGSFTGANSDKEGLFQAASGGSLFLDEVAELPLNMQVKLLRAIQEKAVRPVGAEHEMPVDVRIISASHMDLDQLVSTGRFRQDLYYRINVIDVSVPSLRERIEDIPLLAQQLLKTIAEKSGLEKIPGISRRAMDALMEYSFPGNVRELENILERALALADNNIIEEKDLALHKKPQAAAAAESNGDTDRPLDLVGQEKSSIVQALETTRWNKTAAAKLLGLSLRQLRYRLEKFGIE